MEENKIMKALTVSTIRELVQSVNSMGIKKEDIVTLLKMREDQYILIFYGANLK